MYCVVHIEGELEVSQRDRILGVIGAGKAFGELAVLYNCQRTASVRGNPPCVTVMVLSGRITSSSLLNAVVNQ